MLPIIGWGPSGLVERLRLVANNIDGIGAGIAVDRQFGLLLRSGRFQHKVPLGQSYLNSQ